MCVYKWTNKKHIASEIASERVFIADIGPPIVLEICLAYTMHTDTSIPTNKTEGMRMAGRHKKAHPKYIAVEPKWVIQK